MFTQAIVNGHMITFGRAPKKAKKRAEGANSNVFSMFEQAQIQEFKEVQTKRSFDSNCYDNCLYRNSFTAISCIYSEIPAFTIMDQNRDGFIDKNDLRDTYAALGRLNVKQEELEEMLKEAPGPINFTVFLTMFGEKLKGWVNPKVL
ncbi:myosin regulatory light chain ventricular cardiac muscle isoform [Labeo rohita]|uniref:Myosin regulatory light chain ventricular cardiac muscle isoform n=1 Tax=Labeo rohita TaxID=84645 RepID=A0A498MI26_LABRO|nr:myosin regulatory light chain ventricular cardiac muscle isoform [Labeo rohita]